MKKNIFNVSLVLISLFVVIALGELILRIIRPDQIVHTGREFNFHSFDHTYGWKGKPDATGRFGRYGEYLVQVKNNSMGMRDDEYPVEKKNGLPRFAFLGDSYTWGFGVEHEQIFMEILLVY